MYSRNKFTIQVWYVSAKYWSDVWKEITICDKPRIWPAVPFLFFFRSPEEIKTLFSPSSGKLSSDAVTQITTESPGKATFSSEIFVNAGDHGREIPELSTQKLGNVPVKFASSSSVQQITVPHGTDGKRIWLHFRSYYRLSSVIKKFLGWVLLVKKPDFNFTH